MRYFGPPGDAPVYETMAGAPTPVGEPCFHCAAPIGEDDQGFLIPHIGEIDPRPWHKACFLWSVLGSFGAVDPRGESG